MRTDYQITLKLAEGLSTLPHGSLCEITWVFSQHGSWFSSERVSWERQRTCNAHYDFLQKSCITSLLAHSSHWMWVTKYTHQVKRIFWRSVKIFMDKFKNHRYVGLWHRYVGLWFMVCWYEAAGSNEYYFCRIEFKVSFV